jgi:hypothetical protein
MAKKLNNCNLHRPTVKANGPWRLRRLLCKSHLHLPLCHPTPENPRYAGGSGNKRYFVQVFTAGSPIPPARRRHAAVPTPPEFNFIPQDEDKSRAGGVETQACLLFLFRVIPADIGIPIDQLDRG